MNSHSEEALKIIKDDRPGSAGVPPARMEKNQLHFLGVAQSNVLG